MLRNGRWVRNALQERSEDKSGLVTALAGTEILPFLLSSTIKVMMKDRCAKNRPDCTQSFREVCPVGMYPAGTLQMLEDVDEREKEEEESKRSARKDS